MNDKRAIEILLSLVSKHPLSAEEKEAVHAAIGVLSWTSLSESRIKSLKKRIEESTRWR